MQLLSNAASHDRASTCPHGQCASNVHPICIQSPDLHRVLDRPSNSFLGFGVVLGVVIEFAPSEKDGRAPAANALASALETEGIKATVQPRTDDDKEKQPLTLRIEVRKKF